VAGLPHLARKQQKKEMLTLHEPDTWV
jgi:hypothetical protein